MQQRIRRITLIFIEMTKLYISIKTLFFLSTKLAEWKVIPKMHFMRLLSIPFSYFCFFFLIFIIFVYTFCWRAIKIYVFFIDREIFEYRKHIYEFKMIFQDSRVTTPCYVTILCTHILIYFFFLESTNWWSWNNFREFNWLPFVKSIWKLLYRRKNKNIPDYILSHYILWFMPKFHIR